MPEKLFPFLYMLLGRENWIFYGTSSFNQTFFLSLFSGTTQRKRGGQTAKKEEPIGKYIEERKEQNLQKREGGDRSNRLLPNAEKITAAGVPLVAS